MELKKDGNIFAGTLQTNIGTFTLAEGVLGENNSFSIMFTMTEAPGRSIDGRVRAILKQEALEGTWDFGQNGSGNSRQER